MAPPQRIRSLFSQGSDSPRQIRCQGAEHIKRTAELFCKEAGTAADGKTIQEATADLTDYSLITRQDGGMLVVHRMVQEALRSQIPEEHRIEWIAGTLWILEEATSEPSDEVPKQPAWNRLKPHLAEVMTRAAWLLHDLNQFSEADSEALLPRLVGFGSRNIRALR